MKLFRIKSPNGSAFDPIRGQTRYFYHKSGYEDFYDMPEILKNGAYKGAVITFFDTETGEIDCPFEKTKNVLFSNPIIINGVIYLLRGDFNANKVFLLKYSFGSEPECIYEMSLDGVELYNLSLCGYPVHIVSQHDKLISYYPERFEIPLEPNESLEFIENGRIYLSAWFEDGVEGGAMGEDYRYYNKFRVRDFDGYLLSEESGCLDLYPDGKWRIT
ncbi:MAG: hypothetical protein IJP43_02310 [Oscillospiraceae bacterium]|nr:hypothetical protein [Oscillospiraceae bacterium]